MGGVIIRTEDAAPRLRLAERYGLDRAGVEKLVFGSEAARSAELGQVGEQAVWESIRRALGLNDAQLADFQREFWRGDCLDRSLVELAASLRPGVKTGLLTNAWNPTPLTIFTRQFGLPESFVESAYDVVVSSAAVGLRKPDPRIYQVILARLGAQPAEAVFVDDFIENIEAAQALGMHGVHFRSPAQAVAELHSLLGG